MLKDKSLLCISYSTCPTVYVNKHLSCLTYGKVPTKGRNYVGTRNLRVFLFFFNRKWMYLDERLKNGKRQQSTIN